MDDYGDKSLHSGELMSRILRLKNLNNNNSQEASCCELNGCRAMKPREASGDERNLGKEYDDNQGTLNENGAAKPVDMATTGLFHDEDDTPAAGSNRSSSSNSTGNLSISQEDYDVDDDIDDDDVLFLANQQFADDEVSEQSDDCVYAYRGADFDVLEYRNNNNNNNNIDDETDFLEMDFEPDPASEIDNSTNECNEAKGCGCRKYCAESSADEVILPIKFLDEGSGPPKSRTNYNPSQPAQVVPVAEDARNPTRNQNNISDVVGTSTSEVPENFKMTGAKPKRQLTEKPSATYQSPSPRKLPQQPDTKAGRGENSTKNEPYANGDLTTLSCDESDEPCIDCLENEFLSTTIGRRIESTYCRKCRRRRGGKDFERQPVDDGGFGLNFPPPYDDARIRQNSLASDPARYSSAENYTTSQNADNLLLKRNGKESVSFSSVNVDEKVIIQALDHINVGFNKDIIKAHFENFNNFQSHFDNDVTELILYTSKRNCDYKKIIKLVRLACNDDVDVKFTRDDNVSKETEIVQVRCCDILEIWTTRNQNLERLKKLNKKFIQMNVLGKVINLIRHAQQRNTKSLEEEFIIVPQYYKTGYICITKK